MDPPKARALESNTRKNGMKVSKTNEIVLVTPNLIKTLLELNQQLSNLKDLIPRLNNNLCNL